MTAVVVGVVLLNASCEILQVGKYFLRYKVTTTQPNTQRADCIRELSIYMRCSSREYNDAHGTMDSFNVSLEEKSY